MKRFKSQDAPSGASVKFMTEYEVATNIQVQKQLAENLDAVEQAKKDLVLRMRVDWDRNKAKGNNLNFLSQGVKLPGGMELELDYDHQAKRMQCRLMIGLFQESAAVVDLENEAIGSVTFEPTKLAWRPEPKDAKKGGPLAPPPAPSNAPRLGNSGALKA